MITCRQAENLFDAYLDGELSDGLRCELHAHQLRCSACRRALAILQTTAEVIARDRSEPVLADDFTDRLLACLQESGPAAGTASRRWRRMVLWGGSGLSAAAAMLLALTAWLARGPSDEPSGGVVAGQIVRAIKVYPIGDARTAEADEAVPAILPVSVGYLAETAASAFQDGQAAIRAFTELGRWGFSHANRAILAGAAQDELLSTPADSAVDIDVEHVGALLELSDLLRAPPVADDVVELL